MRPEPALLAELGDALDACQRPVFVVGASVDRDRDRDGDRDGAWDATVALAERHRARVFVAPMSGRCGLPEDHPLFAGFLPAIRERIVQMLSGHDLVLVLGAPAFTYHVEGQGPHLPPEAALLHMIDDPQTAAWAPQGLSVVCSIHLGVQDLLARPVRPTAAQRWMPAAREPRPPAPLPEAGHRLSVAHVLQMLDGLRPRDSIVVEEAPTARSVMQRHLPIYQSETF